MKIEKAVVDQEDSDQVKTQLLSLFHPQESFEWALELLEDQSMQSKQADPLPNHPNYHPRQQKTGRQWMISQAVSMVEVFQLVYMFVSMYSSLYELKNTQKWSLVILLL